MEKNMAEITAAIIKQLREETQAGMLDCKKALEETKGNYEEAKDYLRTKGLAKAAKKASRVAAEGLVGIFVEGNKGAIIELNSETDFVAKNAEFQNLTRAIAKAAINANGDVENLKNQKLESGKTAQEAITESIATIGENMNLRRAAVVQATTNVVSYIHNSQGENIGKIAVLVALKGGNAEIGKQIAMHIAASKPEALNTTQVNQENLAREKAIYSEQARESGKPEAVIEKMVEGRIRKYYEQIVLLEQPFVLNPEQKVADVAKAAGAEIESYAYFVLGEGIEKEVVDFAEEVRAAAGAAA
jgi:elongation factor Ts